MKILSTWTVRQGCLHEAIKRNLAGKADPPEGVKLLGRWYATDVSGGCAIYEADDVALFSAHALQWADLLEIRHVPVIEDAEAGPMMAKLFGK
jgi:hypothetical protein